MDCFSFIIFFIILIAIIANLINQQDIKRKRDQAYRNKNIAEYNKLNNNPQKIKVSNKQNLPSDQDYLDAIMVLDAAEHGVFWPGGEEAIKKIEGPQEDSNDFDDNEDYIDDDDYYNDDDNV